MRLKREKIRVSAPPEPKPEGEWTAVGQPGPHVCRPPLIGVADMESYPKGSVWRCFACGTFHVITRWVTPGGSQDFVPDWEAHRA